MRMAVMGVVRIFVAAFLVGCCLSQYIPSRGIHVERDSFKIYRQEQKTSQKVHIRMQFKTISATGLLMFAQGANKQDFLSIELFRGKIRVAGNFGNGPKNRLRPISGFFTQNLGKDLADNGWHTVEFIADIRAMLLFIDRGTINEKKGFMQSPQTYHELALSQIAFGGYYSFVPSEMSTKKSLARKGIEGCFHYATFSQTYPSSRYNWIDFLLPTQQGKEYPVTIPKGTIVQECKPIVPVYKPLFFPSSAVHLALVENYTIPSLKIEMMFRTVISDQTLANYTTKGTGERIQFRLDRKGRISLSVDIGEDTMVIETAKEGFHDGEWHSASFEIDNKLADKGNYLGMFSADRKMRLATLSGTFFFNGFVHIGFGFTGCMRDIKVNDDVITKIRQNLKVADKFFQVFDVGVVYNSCSLKDYCNPNPCHNSASCNQTEDNMVCNCRNTLYEGSTCHRARFNYTCSGVRKSGERRSDVYFIDFDGMGPMEPVRALCDLGRTVETTTTQINNTKYLDIDMTTDTGTNAMMINYAASITQMRELIMNSAHCQQYIKFTCLGAPLFQSPWGPPVTWWMGGDDVNHYYWGGALNHRGYCECGVTQTCRNIKKYCNCDDLSAFSNVWDEGNFTIKQHLPVREVTFKSVLKDGRIQALLRVGHLRCSGFGSRLVSATFRKRWSFLSVYHPDQPFDNINAGGISFDFKTSIAYNYMTLIHARGPFSGDYIKIMIWSRTLLRVHFNAGFGDFKQDVSLSSIGRTFDDNQWHEFNLMFNMKEMNVTLDGIRMIQGLPLQDDPFEFTVDSKPVYVGGSYHDPFGFVGCIRSLYVNGRIFDLRQIAHGQEDFGVYPGCGAACPILKPCNFGFCIEEYDAFKCNCSVSPNNGIYCQNETNTRKFTGAQSILYDMKLANKSEPVGELIFTLGFKHDNLNAELAQVLGNNDRHFTLALINGYLTLFYTMKKRDKQEVTKPTPSKLVIKKRQLIPKTYNVARVRFSTEEIFLSVVNFGLVVGANATESLYDETNKNKGSYVDKFGAPLSFSVGAYTEVRGTVPSFTGFSGCMAGAKLVYNPRATSKHHFRKSYEVDMFDLIKTKKEGGVKPVVQNPTGTFPSQVTDRCGPEFKAPGTLPSVGPSRQFHTRSPGLDRSIIITRSEMMNTIVLIVVAFLLSILLLAMISVIHRYTRVNAKKYNEIKLREKPIYIPSKQTQHPDPVFIVHQSVPDQYAESKKSTPQSHRSVPGKSTAKEQLINQADDDFL